MIRKAELNDMEGILEVIADAKALFRSKNSTQWQDTDGYPNAFTFEADIANRFLYVYLHDEKIVGVACLSHEEEECYRTIYDGTWLNEEPYFVVHRLAVRKEYYGKGIAKALLEELGQETRRYGVYNLKADTMKNNQPMNTLLSAMGYVRCGIIYLNRDNVLDKERVAYQKVLK